MVYLAEKNFLFFERRLNLGAILLAVDGILNDAPQAVAVQLLFVEKILCPFLDCRLGRLLIVPASENHDGDMVRSGHDATQSTETLLVGQAQVEQDYFRTPALRSESCQGFLDRCSAFDL